MDKNTITNDTTNKILDQVRSQLEESFTLGMRYKRLSVVDKLLPILRENEFSETTIAMILNDVGLLEEDTYANVFANIDDN